MNVPVRAPRAGAVAAPLAPRARAPAAARAKAPAREGAVKGAVEEEGAAEGAAIRHLSSLGACGRNWYYGWSMVQHSRR